MTRLLLLRHAKTEWARPGERDFDRVLQARGQRDSRAMGEAMHALGLAPDLVLCSPARRAAETLELLLPALPGDRPRIEMAGALYATDAARYLRIVNEAPDVECLLLVGHNPMMEDLASELAATGDAAALTLMERGFPTCGLAVLDFDLPLSAIGPASGRLEYFLTPKSLEQAMAARGA